MFKKAQIKLTILYSALFMSLFWLFSFGVYFWMDSSFGEGYISQVYERQSSTKDLPLNAKNARVVTMAADVALDQLEGILIVLNVGLLIIIPIASWFLAKKTLSPVQEAHGRQQQFVSDASHEMRTPLAIITGEIDVILNKKRTSQDYKETLISTREETKRLSTLVENLLFLAKDDHKANAFQFESVDITDVINEVMQSLQTKSSKKQLSVKLSVNDTMDSPIVEGSPLLLRQLFYNVVDNAISYTPPKGKVKIDLSELKRNVTISITDTGVGIAKEDIAKLTRRFYRVDPSRSQIKGYGLGLAIAKSVINRHNGKLLITSEKDKGSTFTIILPKA